MPFDNLPRCNSLQVNRYLLLFAIARTMQIVADGIPERIAAVNDEDLISRILVDTAKLADDLLTTYPAEKQQTMARQAGHLRIKLEATAAPIGTKGHTLIDIGVLGTLIDNAHEQCKLCAHPERCNTCRLGKTFDRCCPEERRKGESWADINVSED